MISQQHKMMSLAARAWADDAFRAQLLANPAAVLAAEGIDVPAGLTVRVVEDTNAVVHLVLPARPDGELSDDVLTSITRGGAWAPFL